MYNGDVTPPVQWGSAQTILSILGCCFGTMAIAVSIYFGRKVNILSLALAHKSEAFTIADPPNFVWDPKAKVQAATPGLSSYWETVSPHVELTSVVANLLLIVITVGLILCIWHWFKKQKCQGTNIELELSDGHQCIMVPVMFIPVFITKVSLPGEAWVSKLKVKASWRGTVSKLQMNWGDRKVRNEVLKMKGNSQGTFP